MDYEKLMGEISTNTPSTNLIKQKNSEKGISLVLLGSPPVCLEKNLLDTPGEVANASTLTLLPKNQDRPNKELSIMDANLALIRAYLSAPSEAVGYGETDESTLTEVVERCSVAPDFCEAWLRDARAWKAAQAVTLPRPHVTHSLPPKTTQCTTCKYLAKPGRSSGYCGGGREDLPKAYGANHPLRKLPQNRGANCENWAWDGW